jgi:hypothetical protein
MVIKDPRDISERTFSPGDVTERLPSGYEGTNVPDFTIPSCGIEDVDRALFNLFDKQIKFQFRSIDGTHQQIPVLFAGTERFALLKQKKPLRDKNGVIILPLISIMRDEIDHSEEGLGRGIGQDTGDLVIRKKLDVSDRKYQNLKNKLQLRNQTDVASPSNSTDREVTDGDVTVRSVGTRRVTGEREFDLWTGEVFQSSISDNIVEIITIPFPEFFNVKYQIVFWAQYQTQMNSMLEQLMASYHAQGNQFRIDTDKGYWFVAFVDDVFSSDTNFDDYTEEERVIRYSFTINTTGYMIAPTHGGQRAPLRRYLSAPMITFGVEEQPEGLIGPRPKGAGTGDIDKFVLSDVEELDRSGEPVLGRNHSQYGKTVYVQNPFSGEQEQKFLRVKTRYQRGEAVLEPADIDELELFIIEP